MHIISTRKQYFVYWGTFTLLLLLSPIGITRAPHTQLSQLLPPSGRRDTHHKHSSGATSLQRLGATLLEYCEYLQLKREANWLGGWLDECGKHIIAAV